MAFDALTDTELQNLWDTSIDFEERDNILIELKKRDLFPSDALKKWEYETGAYPDIIDPEFLQKLLAKREFAESLQQSWKPRVDPCEDNDTFEVTPVQRFVANFMSPKTPYMSALLFHGVGVGKTCAGVQIIEAWLEAYPRTEVYLVAPPTIQQGFYRTIFDISKVKIGEGNDPNTASQCTGVTYMRLTNTLYERDPAKIERAVNRIIKRRYKIFGYISFANFIRDALKGIPPTASDEQKRKLKKEYIRKKFSGKLLLVDEAHNLRDLSEDIAEEQVDLPGGRAEKSDSAGGKQLTPYLRDVLLYAEGMKYCMLTATPMYNTYREIIFMLNLLLMNDKKATINESDVFTKEGDITDSGKKILAQVTQRYVSFMRGENPISFPIRLFPQDISSLIKYPVNNPRGTVIPEEDKIFYNKLPIVPITLKGDVLKASISFMKALPPGKGLSSILLEKLVHAGNFIVPSTEESEGDDIEAYRKRTDINGLSTIFSRETTGGEVRFRARVEGGAKWLGEDQIETYSPKFKFLLDRVRNSEGVVFAYTRFVNAGAIPLALVLEANGYSPYGRRSGLLGNGIQTPGGKQCALCPKREKSHSGESHPFTPAYYGILTGDDSISPKNEATIRAERDISNADGSKMKIIIGSQIASEGVDLRFVRETHVIDSWFHLNKTEQILGRAIRFLSHCALPKEKRNNTVYLYAGVIPDDNSYANRETADMYSYRIGFKKAVQVGNVTRIMKQSAIDCNLNNNAIIIQGQEPVTQIDSQRKVRDNVDVNDMPFTAVCDWIETCQYTCNPTINVKELGMDDSTYDEYSARWRIEKMKERVRLLFAEQTFYRTEDLWELISDVPRIVAVDLLNEITNNKAFTVTHEGISGYIRYCNGYYIFQPNVYIDLTIPLAVRTAKFPIKRDVFTPISYDIPEIIEDIEDELYNTKESINIVWSAISKWCQDLSTSAKYIIPPDEINQRISDISKGDVEVFEKYRQILEMVEWFHYSFHRSQNKDLEAFRKTLLFYFWDTWVTLEEQKFIIYSTDIDVLECVRENQISLGKLLINRFIDPKTTNVQLICEGGESCKPSIIEEVARDKSDVIKGIKINTKTTGKLYGFSVPKNGEIIFKTSNPPEEAGKLGRGKECGNVSTMTGHINNLLIVGEILKEAGKGDFDLRKEILVSTRKVKNSTRACTLMEILIRFLDLNRINNKRWFFRPVQSYYIGHKGTVRPSAK